MNDAERAAKSTAEGFQRIIEKVVSTMRIYGGAEVEIRPLGNPKDRVERREMDDRLFKFVEELFDRAKRVDDERGEGWETVFNTGERCEIADILNRRGGAAIIDVGDPGGYDRVDADGHPRDKEFEVEKK